MPVSNNNNAPGRPREFDIDEAVELAMQVFWTRGYHATSLVDLIEGTGLSRGSLYKAFGDKHGLFIAVLRRYMATANEQMSLILRKSAPVKLMIREVLTNFAQLSCGCEGQRGCLLLATATEMVPHDAEITSLVNAMYNQMGQKLTAVIQSSQSTGEIPAKLDAQATASLILSITHGMRVLGKAGGLQSDINLIVDTAMKLLD